jgi:MraZ protein
LNLQSIDVKELQGVYECKMDAKGRVSVPASLKKQLLSLGSHGFILKRSVFSKCLELHTQDEWASVTNSLKKLNRFIKKNNEFIRMFHAGVKQVEMDSSGRILISKDLINFANLESNIVFSATPFGLEIWNLSDYEKAVNLEDNDFAQLTEEVMGEKNSDGIS